jgi:tetratricopeptide (TPR) repeat protein
LDSTDFPPLIVKRSQANFQNRRCVTLKTLGRRAEATAAGQASLKLASEYKMPGLICLNLIDLGYVEYGLRDRNQNLLALWEKARDAVPDDSDNIDLSVDISDIRIIGKLISSAVLTLRNDNANAMSQLDQLILDCRERSDYFYQIRAMALKGVALLRHALTETDQSIAMEVCAQALALGYALEDITGSMGEAQRYRSAIYITGKAYETLGEIDKAKRKYKSAADISVSKSFDYEADALSYDIQRLAGRTKTRPSATTYSIGDILLPLP